MSVIYLLKNQHDEFLDKAGEWVREADSKSLFRTEYKDEAINLKVEYSVKKPDLRISLAEAAFNEKGKIVLQESAASFGRTEESHAAHDTDASNDAEVSDSAESPAEGANDDSTQPTDEASTQHSDEHKMISAEHVFGVAKHEEIH